MSSSKNADASAEAEIRDQSSQCLSFQRAGSWLPISVAAQIEQLAFPRDFLKFLGVVQYHQIDVFPITWHPALDTIGEGATAEIRAALIDLQTSYAFKRYILSDNNEEKLLLHIISEVSILGLESIRNHPNIIKLEGVAWDINNNNGQVWPVLVFEKAEHGDLETFFTSNPGKDLTFEERLDLCIHIGTALMVLSAHNVIHGDLGNRNVLVFEEPPGKFIAKVSDFGYSSMLGDQDSVYLPHTRPWYAPEWHRRAFTLSHAVRMDIFSYGLLCLWILFQDEPAFPSLHDIEALKLEQSLLGLSDQLIATAMPSHNSTRANIASFFHLSLAHSPERRPDQFSKLVQLLSSGDSSAAYSSPANPLKQSSVLDREFNVVPIIMQFYYGDIRVRQYIAHRLKVAAATDSDTSLYSGPELQNVLFQLAICSEIGFGVRRSRQKSLDYLNRSGMTQAQLDDHINVIKEVKYQQSFFHNDSYRKIREKELTLDIEYDRRYGKHEQLDALVTEHREEIDDIEAVMGSKTPISLILKSRLGQILNAHGLWAQCEALYMEIVTTSVEVLGREHSVTMHAMEGLGVVFWNQSRLDEAEKIEREVIELGKAVYEPDDPQTLTQMVNLASTLREKGQWEEAEELFLYALEKRKSSLGTENPIFLTTKGGLAQLYRSMGRWAEAEKLEIEVIESRTRLFGPDHPDTLSGMSNLGNTIIRQGRWEEAHRLFSLVAEKTTAVLGENHPDTISAMSHLASGLSAQGLWDEAEKIERQVLERILVLGLEHPDVLTLHYNLALTCRNRGKWDEAEDLIRRVQQQQEKSLGPENIKTIASVALLSSILLAQGQLAEADKLAMRAVETRKAVLGSRHPETLQSMTHLGSVLLAEGQYERAEEVFLEVARNSDVLGAEHPDTLANLTSLASVRMHQGKLETAEELYSQLLEIYIRVQGEDHPDTQTVAGNLALVYKSGGRLEEAKTQEVKILEISSRVLGDEHPDTLVTMMNLAMTLGELGEWEEARTTGMKGMELMVKTLGAENRDALASMRCMAQIFAKQGSFDEAEKLCIQAVKGQAEVLGGEHPDTVVSAVLLNEIWSQKSSDADAAYTERI